MAFSFPSGSPGNTYVPSFDATGQLVAAYSRNPKDFALNKYVTITPVKKGTGYFLRITAEQAARVINTDLSEFVWPDGNDAPSGKWGTESFSFFPYLTERYTFPFSIGFKAEEQADWKILAAYAAFTAQDAMTARTMLATTALTTTGNYDSGHTSSTATGIGGGAWSSGTKTNPVIMKSLNLMAQKIQQDTLGRVRPRDLVLVISPTSADIMARSAEVRDYVAQAPVSMQMLRGEGEDFGIWGLPPTLYGFKIVIEDAVRVSTRKGASSQTKGYILGNQAALIARPGELTSIAGGPSFSFLHSFMYEEMTVEQKQDIDNRLIKGRVVEDYSMTVVAPASGYLITDVTS